MRVAPFLVALLVCGCNEATSPSRLIAPSDESSNNTVNEKLSDDFIGIAAACNGETVIGTADEHVQTKNQVKKDGSFSYSARVDSHITAYGELTGAKYEGRSRAELAFSDWKKESTSTEYIFTLIGQGQAPNLRIKATTSVREGKPGEPPVVTTSYSNTCEPDGP